MEKTDAWVIVENYIDREYKKELKLGKGLGILNYFGACFS